MKELLRLHFLDVGFGDSIVLEMPGGRVGVIDSPDAQVTLVYLRTRISPCPRELEFLAATHPHQDHIGGLRQIAEAIQPREFWDGEHEHTSNSYRLLRSMLLASPRIRWVSPRAGTVFRQGGVTIRTLAPPPNLLIDGKNVQSILNNASLSLRVAYGRFTAILGGDAQFNSWAYQMLNHGKDLEAHVLKMPHHGSNVGISFEVIRHIAPRYAIVSVGANMHSLPDEETMAHLHHVVGKSNVYRTDLNGNIVVETNGRSWAVRSDK